LTAKNVYDIFAHLDRWIFHRFWWLQKYWFQHLQRKGKKNQFYRKICD